MAGERNGTEKVDSYKGRIRKNKSAGLNPVTGEAITSEKHSFAGFNIILDFKSDIF